MAFTDSMLWQIAEQIQTALRAITYEVASTEYIAAIRDEAIVIRQYTGVATGPTDERLTRTFAHEEVPGILITPSSHWGQTPVSAGVTVFDDTSYEFLCQFVADGNSGEATGNLRTISRWAEQCRRKLQNQDFGAAITGSGGRLFLVYTEITSVPDRRKFVLHNRFVVGILVTAQTREPRG